MKKITAVLLLLLTTAFFSFPAASCSAVSISRDELTSKIWIFSRSDGTLLAGALKLGADGKIVDGTGHWNETSWKYVNGTLYFYGGDGSSITTTYDSVQKVNGKWVLSGPYAYDASFTHVLTEAGSLTPIPAGNLSISRDELISKIWSFSRSDGTLLAGALKLGADGKIVDGTGHWNETSWKYVNGTLYFYGGDGSSITTTYDSVQKVNGKWVLSGPYAYDASFTHVLTEVGSLAPTTPIPSTTPAGGTSSESFESGARMSWNSYAGAIGYRLYRSTNPGQLGISVTDFYFTSFSFADVNVEPNTTYYYSVKPVLAEANPYEGIAEKLGPVIATFTIRTGGSTYKPGSFKNFIILKLNDPYLTKNGIKAEIDPGRGTTPLVISSRTMVPIRAIVEAMGGNALWDEAAKKITLNARGNTVEMWLGKTDIAINGAYKKMDVSPLVRNARTFVPVRFSAENLNCKVDWLNSTQEVIIVYED